MADRLGYNPGTFVNGQAPAIDATLMNAIKNALNTSTFDADRLAGTTPGARGLTALSQATTLNADTVSGYGIGVEAATNANATTITKTGFYKLSGPSGGPFGAAAWLCLHIENASGVGAKQLGFDFAGFFQSRYRNAAGSWSNWDVVWTSATDGNGGQPPAPKPNSISDTTPGYEVTTEFAPGNSVVLGSGGTWLVEHMTVGGTFSSTSPILSSQTYAYVNGGSTITHNGAGNGRIRYLKIT